MATTCRFWTNSLVWPPLVESGRIAWPDDEGIGSFGVSAEFFVAYLVPGLFFVGNVFNVIVIYMAQ